MASKPSRVPEKSLLKRRYSWLARGKTGSGIVLPQNFPSRGASAVLPLRTWAERGVGSVLSVHNQQTGHPCLCLCGRTVEVVQCVCVCSLCPTQEVVRCVRLWAPL